ncbi:MAG: TIGR04255 family protein [Gemmatimonadota bacterium]|nr:TIGR04255 family protein [Gemmatimonadota bacterium]
MAHQRHLSKAPIREAVLDVGVAGGTPVDLRLLRNSLESTDRFPEVHDITSESSPQHTPNEQDLEHGSGPGGVIGVRGFTDERDWVVDFRRDGLTFSRRSPYPSWREYSGLARPLVEEFLSITMPAQVVRLGLRYVNHFRLPDRDPRDYFVSLPSLPDSLSLSVDRLLTSTTARHSESGRSVHVMHVLLDDLAPGRIGHLLDIDVFSDNRFGPEEDQIRGTFESLRDFKNRIFFELITERNARLHE